MNYAFEYAVAVMAIVMIIICVLEDKQDDLAQPQGCDEPEPDPRTDP